MRKTFIALAASLLAATAAHASTNLVANGTFDMDAEADGLMRRYRLGRHVVLTSAWRELVRALPDLMS